MTARQYLNDNRVLVGCLILLGSIAGWGTKWMLDTTLKQETRIVVLENNDSHHFKTMEEVKDQVKANGENIITLLQRTAGGAP